MCLLINKRSKDSISQIYCLCLALLFFAAEEAFFPPRTNVFQLSWSNPFSIVFMYFCLALPELHWLPVCLEAYKHKSDLLETFS